MNVFEKIKNYINPEVKEIYLVEIIYKNGQRVSMWCSDYEVSDSDHLGRIISITIHGEYADKYPSAYYGGKKAIYVGVADISSFWQIGSMKVKV